MSAQSKDETRVHLGLTDAQGESILAERIAERIVRAYSPQLEPSAIEPIARTISKGIDPLVNALANAENWLTEFGADGPDTGLHGLIADMREALSLARGGGK